MARWIIVNKADLSIQSDYQADGSQLGGSVYGGPWNDPTKVMHLKTDSTKPLGELQCISEAQGQLRDTNDEPLSDVVDTGLKVRCCDSGGEPVLDAEGLQIVVQRYVRQSRLGLVHRIIER